MSDDNMDIVKRMTRVLEEHTSRGDGTDRDVLLTALVAECEATARYMLGHASKMERERDQLRHALDSACLCAGCKARYEEVTGEPHRKAESEALQRQISAMGEALQRIAVAESAADAMIRLAELRAEGYAVAVHNDYRTLGQLYTFWLFTHPDGTWIKGEGASDGEALQHCVAMADLRRGR